VKEKFVVRTETQQKSKDATNGSRSPVSYERDNGGGRVGELLKFEKGGGRGQV